MSLVLEPVVNRVRARTRRAGAGRTWRAPLSDNRCQSMLARQDAATCSW
jgi:hypothetical protein